MSQLVLLYDGGLVTHTRLYDFAHETGIALRNRPRRASSSGPKSTAPDQQPVLDHLSETVGELGPGQRRQRLGLDHDEVGLVEEPRKILACLEVDARSCLPRSSRPEQVDWWGSATADAPLVGRGREAG